MFPQEVFGLKTTVVALFDLMRKCCWHVTALTRKFPVPFNQTDLFLQANNSTKNAATEWISINSFVLGLLHVSIVAITKFKMQKMK